MDKLALGVAVAILVAGCVMPVQAEEDRQTRRRTPGFDWDAVKQDWPHMGPIERAVWERIFAAKTGRMEIEFPSEACLTATLPADVTELPFTTQNTTRGRVDQLDLSFDGACAGGGTQFSGTGLGPDLVYKIHVDIPCDLLVAVDPLVVREDPLEWDVALYIIREPVQSRSDGTRPIPCRTQAESCVSSSDGGGVGETETIAFSAATDEDYFIVVDGYLGGAGVFELEIVETTGTGCSISRMTLGGLFAD